jgi:hypothetical protein
VLCGGVFVLEGGKGKEMRRKEEKLLAGLQNKVVCLFDGGVCLLWKGKSTYRREGRSASFRLFSAHSFT